MFFFNDTATTEIYTLALHDALPIYRKRRREEQGCRQQRRGADQQLLILAQGQRHQARGQHHATQQHEEERVLSVWKDRKSTRLNSSHANISYAVFCLKKKI